MKATNAQVILNALASNAYLAPRLKCEAANGDLDSLRIEFWTMFEPTDIESGDVALAVAYAARTLCEAPAWNYRLDATEFVTSLLELN